MEDEGVQTLLRLRIGDVFALLTVRNSRKESELSCLLLESDGISEWSMLHMIRWYSFFGKLLIVRL
jgi:hypothetical protein